MPQTGADRDPQALPGVRPARGRIVARVVLLCGLCLLLGWRVRARGLWPGPLTAGLYAALLAAACALERALRPLAPARDASATPALDRRRRLALTAATALVAWSAAELLLLLWAFALPGQVRRLGFRLPGDGPAQLGGAFFDAFHAQRFDPDLGWDVPAAPPFGRARRAPVVYPRTLASSYGDSFTACFGPDEETWQTHLGARLQANVVNFGVPGYGPDQALLKLRREYPRLSTPLVFFGYFSESVARLVNVDRGALDVQFYASCFLPDGRPIFEPTKPRFVLEDGRLRLRPNPVKTRADLDRLVHDPAFRAALGARDFFQAGYDLEAFCPELRFPRTLLLGRGLLRRARESGPRPDYAVRLLADDGTFALLLAVFDDFAAFARERAFVPLVLVFGQQDDLRTLVERGAHGRLRRVLAALEARGYAYVDTLAVLAEHHRASTPPTSLAVYFDETSHLSLLSQRILADALARHRVVRAALEATEPKAVGPRR